MAIATPLAERPDESVRRMEIEGILTLFLGVRDVSDKKMISIRDSKMRSSSSILCKGTLGILSTMI